MKAAVYFPNSNIKIKDLPIPKISEDELLLQVKACGICGTDVLKVNRAIPKTEVVLGHELTGEVIKIGSQVKSFQVGDRIVVAHHVPCGTCHYCQRGSHSMCRHFKKTNLEPGGFAEYLKISAEHLANTAFKIPDNIEDEVALFTEPLSCCVKNIRRAEIHQGDWVCIVGMGSIGLMTLQLLKLFGAHVLALDLLEERLELAKQLGADEVAYGNSSQLHKTINRLTENRGMDLVILSAGNQNIVQESLEWIRDGGSLNLFASLSNEPVPINIDKLYHREIKIFTSYSPSPQDLAKAHELLINKKIKVKPLITHHLKLDQINEAIDMINSGKAMKVIIHPQEA